MRERAGVDALLRRVLRRRQAATVPTANPLRPLCATRHLALLAEGDPSHGARRAAGRGRRTRTINPGGSQWYANLANLFETPNFSGEEGQEILHRDLLDAMELMCEVAASAPRNGLVGGRGGCFPQGGVPVYEQADIGRLQAQLGCASDRLNEVAQRRVAQNVPGEVVAALRGETTDTRPDLGAYGSTLTDLRTALRRTAEIPQAIGDQLSGAADDIEMLKSVQNTLELKVIANWLKAVSTVALAAIDCASQATGPGGGWVCASAAVVAGSALAMAAVEEEIADLEANQALINFRQSIRPRLSALQSLENELANSDDTLSGIIAQLDQSRVDARAALARAAFASSDAAGRHYHVNTVMRRSYNINLQRYQDAHRAAVTSAVVARRAVEQRFGVDLDTLECSSLVEPPRIWASDICNAEGINYGALRDPDAEEPTPENIRQMFVGDYVRRLEQWVESYRFDFPYTSGDDVAVVSVRDDLANVAGPCVAGATNLLGASNVLTATRLPLDSGLSDDPLEAELAWHVPTGGCTQSFELVPGSGVNVARNCVDVEPIDGPGATGMIDSEPPKGFRVTFAPNCDVVGELCDYTDAAAWVQDVSLSAGVYRLSWYARTATARVTVASSAGLEMQAGVGGDPAVFAVLPANQEHLAAPWTRYFSFFRVRPGDSGAIVSVGVFPDTPNSPPTPLAYEVAGLQLEDVSATVGRQAEWQTLTQTVADANYGVYYPSLFVSTTSPRHARFDRCQTSDPISFQQQWRYDCQRLCGSGFSSERCEAGETPELFCYWEYPFTLSEEQLLSRSSGFSGGFAFGNFNYRTGTIAVNLVGTGVRDCDGPAARSCLGSGTLAYSLSHHPLSDRGSGYDVRGHDGQLQSVELFPGRIESARALAAERFLTNPVSSSDRALLADYSRRELSGRPMPGQYVLRIWDAPGVNFGAVEDVQILWNYRYFTRTAERTCTPSP
ncbi:MAG: hypothetical protein SangKO_073960 [Sandaracinaceae bacterium]